MRLRFGLGSESVLNCKARGFVPASRHVSPSCVFLLFPYVTDATISHDHDKAVGYFTAGFDQLSSTLSRAIVPDGNMHVDTRYAQDKITRENLCEWVRLFDPRQGMFYFHNNFSRISTWEKPHLYSMPACSTRMMRGLLLQREIAAALAIQQLYRACRARQLCLDARKMQTFRSRMHRAIYGWTKEFDPKTR